MNVPTSPPPLQSEQELLHLVEQFEARTLPEQQWTHHAHLTVAAWYLYHFDVDSATCLLRSGIITYNTAVGGKNTPTSGYHEAMTLFWIWAVNAFVAPRKGKQPISTIIYELLRSPYASNDLPFRFYSEKHLMSTTGRARWVEPDLHPLKERWIHESS